MEEKNESILDCEETGKKKIVETIRPVCEVGRVGLEREGKGRDRKGWEGKGGKRNARKGKGKESRKAKGKRKWEEEELAKEEEEQERKTTKGDGEDNKGKIVKRCRSGGSASGCSARGREFDNGHNRLGFFLPIARA